MDYLFILGAGASVDSGLYTYRGENSNKTFISASVNDDIETIWNSFGPLFNIIKKCNPGETYNLINKIVLENPKSVILTQNVDGYILSSFNSLNIQSEVIELHGNINYSYCKKCNKKYQTNPNNIFCCGDSIIPNIILFGEDLNKNVIIKAKKLCKNKYKAIIIIGTTLQFPYLRQLISLAKGYNSKVIHINPDLDYNTPIYKFVNYSSLGKKIKKNNNVRNDEIWIQKNAAEGLKEYFNIL